MQRRSFLRQLALVTGGMVATSFIPASFRTGRKIKGKVRASGKGIAGVVVSDGYSVVQTNSNGKYELEPHPDALAIFMSTPSGYTFPQDKGIARQYYPLGSSGKEFDFELQPLGRNDEDHQFIIWADPQVKNMKDVDKMMEHTVPDVQRLVQEAGPDALIHGITVGDIVWDQLKLFGEYDKAVNRMGIPFFQCLGNHDMDYNKGGDETSDDSFQAAYGPTYYSFNRGLVHYVVMDNVRYLGKDRDYDGFFQQNQLDWLKKDLAYVPEDRLVILCVHIPVHSGVKNREDLYEILGKRNVHIMSGHTHYHVNSIRDNIYEHNHGTVCGAWWTGPICVDGTPNGYGVYKVNGKEISWHYQATGKPADHQMSVFVNDYNSDNKQVQVNIWNHDPEWRTEYFVDGRSMGALEQFEGFDPMAFSTMMGPDLPKPRGFAEPKKTRHLFKALVPAGAREIKVVATDRFGKKYTESQTLTA